MERLPDEIIGEILSRISDAREVVVASTTCKGWRRAMQFHLKCLSFVLGYMEIHRLETIVDQTVLQTKMLESLSVVNDEVLVDTLLDVFVDVKFSADRVLGWLMHTKDTLRELRLYLEIYPRINLFDKCQWNKLEVLELGRFSFSGVELVNMTPFPCLKKLVLEDVKLSALELNDLIALCPKIESLRLVSIDVGSDATLDWCIDTLKNIDVVAMSLEKFALVADNLVSLRVERCKLQLFKLDGGEAMKSLYMHDSAIHYVDFGEKIKSLEILEVMSSTFKWPELPEIISKSKKIRVKNLFRYWSSIY